MKEQPGIEDESGKKLGLGKRRFHLTKYAKQKKLQFGDVL